MINYSTADHKFTYVWKKYRPAILNLMVASADGPQTYQLSNHEFKDIHPKEKSGYSFNLQVFQGKAINNIKTSTMAKDLLLILQQSKTVSELTDVSTYEFVLDKQFVLHISQSAAPEASDADAE
ncbi:MAG: hypothetical protein OEY56_09020 [Cyclobacteriaceae bacterium]|nr:hypothetical protein [Cyclobacteriaceae bacterium]